MIRRLADIGAKQVSNTVTHHNSDPAIAGARALKKELSDGTKHVRAVVHTAANEESRIGEE